MSDLISREKVLDEISKIDTSIIPSGWVKGYVDEAIKETQRIIRTIPSAEPEERTAKVSNQIFNNSNPYTVGAWIGTCECGELVSYSSKYCHMCGARLEWNE